MTERSHHLQWLTGTEATIKSAEQSAAIDETLRQAIQGERRVCLQVLDQNPESALARTYLSRLDALLGSPGAEPAPTTAMPDNWIAAGKEWSVDPADFTVKTDSERALETEIDHWETQMATLGTELLPKIDGRPQTSPEAQALRFALRYPFELVDGNRTNPLRNAAVAERIAAATQLPPVGVLLGSLSRRTVAYDQLTRNPERFSGQPMDRLYAAYGPLQASIFLQTASPQTRRLPLFALFHECHHVAQHANRLQQEGMAYVERLVRLGEHVILDDEYQAYGLELEAINCLHDDRLRQTVARGSEPTFEELQTLLQSTNDEWMVVESLRRFAQSYFKGSNAATNQYHPSFKDLVARDQFTLGKTVYAKGAQGNAVQVFPGGPLP